MTTRHDRQLRAQPLLGRLLVATPALKDPNFERSVVLIVGHDDEGALGLILNRATEMEVGEILAGWDRLATGPAVVFEGGPVQPEAAICLARLRGDEDVKGFSRVAGLLGTVDLSRSPEHFAGRFDGLRVFAGYAGWAPHQLEMEIADGAWLVFDALPGDAFVAQPDDLWSMVFKRQGGLLAAVALFPSDPVLN